MNQNISDTIKILRSLLCIMIVFLHMGITGMVYQEVHAPHLFKTVSSFIILTTRIAVPLFFTISGYLFFISYKNTIADYKRKIGNRTRHLLQPILIFTSIFLLFYFAAQQIPYTSNLFSGQQKFIIDYNWKDFFNTYTGFFTEESMFAGQYWFLRNLFIISALSPLLFLLFKYTRSISILIVGAVWLFHPLLPINGYIITTAFFFMLGGWIGYEHLDLAQLHQKTFLWSWLFIPLLLLAFFIPTYVEPLTLLIGILWLFNICYRLILTGKGKALIYLESGSYFCFLLHQQILMFAKRASYKVLSPDSSLTMLLLYIFIPVITICICYCSFFFLQKRYPAILSFLLGTNKCKEK